MTGAPLVFTWMGKPLRAQDITDEHLNWALKTDLRGAGMRCYEQLHDAANEARGWAWEFSRPRTAPQTCPWDDWKPSKEIAWS